VPAELKQNAFSVLMTEAAACRACSAMHERTAVLNPLNGSLHAKVMFIGEAPGRQGADRTRTPFVGDQSGVNLDRYLASIRLARDQIFITNAALCNPRSDSGANRKPSNTELANCSGFLCRQIELIDPRLIVTLGAVSLDALRRIEYHALSLKDAAGKIHEWSGRLLVPVYHPSPQVLASHRREAAQLRDYRAIAQALKRANLSRAGSTC
jgi:uracil-DNA glycosylase family 4